MSTITPNKTAGTSLISLQSLPGSGATSVVISSAVDVSAKLAGLVCIHFGRRATTALTVGVNFRIEASAKASGDGHWFPLALYTTAIALSETEAVSGTVNAGTNVITVASTTNLTAGDIVYIDNGTIANSEWGRVKTISANTSITIEDNLVNAQTSSNIYDQAEIVAIPVDLSNVTRLRVVADGSGTGQNTAIEVELVTFDSLTVA